MAIKLKERCMSCGGSGAYCAAGVCVPCWTCLGRGWVHGEMRSPDPKWAKEHARIERERSRQDEGERLRRLRLGGGNGA